MNEQENLAPAPDPETESLAATETPEAHTGALADTAPIVEEAVGVEDMSIPPTTDFPSSEEAPSDPAETVADSEEETKTVQALGELKETVASIAESVRIGSAATSKLESRLASMEGRMERLAADFAARLRFDAVKDDVISKQGKELDGFRRGAVAKELSAIIENLIHEIDGTRRLAKRLGEQPVTEANYKKAIDALWDGAEALEDSVLSRVAVKRFKTPEGKDFDPLRHVLVKDGHEDTEDASKAGLIARSIRCGYERIIATADGQTRTLVVRPEQVSIWRLVEVRPASSVDSAPEEPAPTTLADSAESASDPTM